MASEQERNRNAQKNLEIVLKEEGITVKEFATEYTCYSRQYVADVIFRSKTMKTNFRRLTAKALMIGDDLLSASPEVFAANYKKIETRRVIQQVGVLASFDCSRSNEKSWDAVRDNYQGSYVVYFRRPRETQDIVRAYLSFGEKGTFGIAAQLSIPHRPKDDDDDASPQPSGPRPGNYVTQDYSGVALPIGRWLYVLCEQTNAPPGRNEVLCLITQNLDEPKKVYLKGQISGIEYLSEFPGATMVVLDYDASLNDKNWRDHLGRRLGVFPKAKRGILRELAPAVRRTMSGEAPSNSRVPKPLPSKDRPGRRALRSDASK